MVMFWLYVGAVFIILAILSVCIGISTDHDQIERQLEWEQKEVDDLARRLSRLRGEMEERLASKNNELALAHQDAVNAREAFRALKAHMEKLAGDDLG